MKRAREEDFLTYFHAKYIEEPAEKPEEKALSSKKGKRKGVSRKKASNEDDEIKWL